MGRRKLHHMLISKEVPLLIILFKVLTIENNSISKKFRDFIKEMIIPENYENLYDFRNDLNNDRDIIREACILEIYHLQYVLEQILDFKTKPNKETGYKKLIRESDKEDSWTNNLVFVTDIMLEVIEVFNARFNKDTSKGQQVQSSPTAAGGSGDEKDKVSPSTASHSTEDGAEKISINLP